MSAEGWISLHRSIRENWVFDDSEFLRAWIVLLLKAQKYPKEQMFGDDLILLETGDIVSSELKLMSELKLSKTKLRRFLKLLQKSKMISKESTRKGTKLRVLNYKYFQGMTNHKETDSEPITNQLETKKKPIRNQKEASNNKEIKRIRDKEINNTSNEVYENYISIGQNRSYHKTSISLKHIEKLLKTYSKEQLIEYANNYRNTNPDEKYLIACSNFYGTHERFKDFTEKTKKDEPELLQNGDPNPKWHKYRLKYGTPQERIEYLMEKDKEGRE